MKRILDRKYMMFVRNGEHYNLFCALSKNITQEMAKELKIWDFWKTFVDALEKENEAYLNSQKYANTVTVKETKKICHQRYSALSLQIRANRQSFVPEIAEAAERVHFALSPYKGLTTKTHAETIAMMLDLTEKLLTEKYAPDVETLGLTSEVVELRQSAQRFQTELSTRANERLARVYRINMVRIRPVVEAAFADLADLITASYLTAAYMDRDAERAARVEQIIDRMNAEILRTIETVSRRSAKAKGKTPAETPEEPTLPEAPIEPGTAEGNELDG
ncbi:MAG: DUF6261 family protein [Parabacteroides sp.]